MNSEQMKPRLAGIRLIGAPGRRGGAGCSGTGCIPVIAGGDQRSQRKKELSYSNEDGTGRN